MRNIVTIYTFQIFARFNYLSIYTYVQLSYAIPEPTTYLHNNVGFISYPTNTPRPRFNVDYTWCVCKVLVFTSTMELPKNQVRGGGTDFWKRSAGEPKKEKEKKYKSFRGRLDFFIFVLSLLAVIVTSTAFIVQFRKSFFKNIGPR